MHGCGMAPSVGVAEGGFGVEVRVGVAVHDDRAVDVGVGVLKPAGVGVGVAVRVGLDVAVGGTGVPVGVSGKNPGKPSPQENPCRQNSLWPAGSLDPSISRIIIC